MGMAPGALGQILKKVPSWIWGLLCGVALGGGVLKWSDSRANRHQHRAVAMQSTQPGGGSPAPAFDAGQKNASGWQAQGRVVDEAQRGIANARIELFFVFDQDDPNHPNPTAANDARSGNDMVIPGNIENLGIMKGPVPKIPIGMADATLLDAGEGLLPANEPGYLNAKADTQGAFVIDIPQSGRYRLVARADGYTPGFSPELQASVHASTTIFITLTPLHTELVYGRVVDQRKAGISMVRVVAKDDNGNVVETRSASDGAFEMALPLEGNFTLEFDHPERVRATQTVIDRNKFIDIVLAPAFRIEGDVMSVATQKPIVGAEVQVTSPKNLSLSARTQSEGSFELQQVPNEDVQLTLRAPGHVSKTIKVDGQRFSRFSHKLNIGSIDLEPAGGLEVFVTDKLGIPISAARVLLPALQETHETTSQGGATFPNLPAATYDVRIEATCGREPVHKTERVRVWPDADAKLLRVAMPCRLP